MLTTLIGSRPQESRAAVGAAVSVVIHGALIVMAVVETAHTVSRPHDAPVERHIVYFPPRPAPPPARTTPSTPAPARPIERTINSPGPVIQQLPPQAPVGPVRENVNLSAPQTDAGVSTAGIADSTPGASSAASGAGSAGDGVSAPLTGDEVERPVQALRPASPRYPEMLRAAGVTGTVRVRFVVDTSGAVEPGSIEMLDATQAAFGDAVRAALLATRYRAAESNGHRVRQLVEQAFTFRLK